MIEAEGNRRILSPPKTGRIYNKGGSFHQASAPGEAPANFTGKLVRSSHVSVNRSKLSATVTWRALYADMLEAGTENMEPRPFARPAAAKLQKTIQRNIDRAIKTEMKRK